MAEPQFPLPASAAPTCLGCGGPCIRRDSVKDGNRHGHTGRPFYTCEDRKGCGKFSCWDDRQGIVNGNPRCWCRYTSRRVTLKGRNPADFYTCAVGRCSWSKKVSLAPASNSTSTTVLGWAPQDTGLRPGADAEYSTPPPRAHMEYSTSRPAAHTEVTNPRPGAYMGYTSPQSGAYMGHTNPPPGAYAGYTTPPPGAYAGYTTPPPGAYMGYTTPRPGAHIEYTLSRPEYNVQAQCVAMKSAHDKRDRNCCCVVM